MCAAAHSVKVSLKMFY